MDALMILAFLLPLVLAMGLILPRRMARWVLVLAPLAPLPALLVALGAPSGLTLDLPWLLLGSRYVLDETGRLFLGFTALVWLVASVYARAYLVRDDRRRGFWAFFLVTQAGNLGLCVAADVASFYFLFALMTFAGYGLVVHVRTSAARRAGWIYLIMAILGEAAVVMGLLLQVNAAGSHFLAELATGPVPPTAIWLLMVGFGVKVGLPLLHMWLPLAHPVAPVPASAVLSGVMLKAGLLGWLRFLPLGQAAPDVGATMMAAGLAAAFLGVAAGLMQRDAKVLLAYSSVSQMGYMTLGVGAGFVAPEHWPMLLLAVTLYAIHHAVAKSALFLGVGVAKACGGRAWVLAGMALPALALAGAPYTSGMVVKLQLKAALAGLAAPWDGILAWLLPLAALGTALLMVRLLLLLAAESAHGGGRGLALPWWLAVLLGLWPAWLPQRELAPVASAGAALAATWPLLIAVGLAAASVRLGLRSPTLPAGDLVVPLERLFAAWRALLCSRCTCRARWVCCLTLLKHPCSGRV
ncbi:MAG: complex I subunit 5 family protein [Burkholderiaceae bacterium]|nr:complex I subunit 5 family protein [Burkholderiaceae bacterium]